MKYRHIIIAVTAILLTGSVVTSSGEPPCPKGKKGDKEYQYRMFADLKLNDQQKEKLKKLHDDMKEQRTKHFEAVKAVRTKIKTELLKEKPSKNTLYKYAAELGKLHEKMSKAHGDHLLKVKKVLTADQFKAVVEKQKNGMHRCRKFKGKDGKCHHRGHGHHKRHGGLKDSCPRADDTPTK